MITVRKALPEDAAEMANVHISSWREAYTELMPPKLIADLPLQFKRRYQLWQAITPLAEQVTLVAEHRPSNGPTQVVGLVNGSTARDEVPSLAQHNYCELYCLYLLEAFHQQQVGYRLMQEFARASLAMGYDAGYVWVLEGNPAQGFYERTGAVLTGAEKVEEMGGRQLKELALAWDAPAWRELAQG